MEKKVERESNFELLRIVAMIMIFVFHYCIHGDIYKVNAFTPNKLFGMYLSVFGRLGVMVFILIMGYFMIESKFKIKRLIKVVLQVLFYSIIMFAIGMKISNLTLQDVPAWKFVFPIYNTVYWFMTEYVYVYLLTPFLNKAVKGMGKDTGLRFIIVFGIMFSLIPDFTMKELKPYNSFIYFVYVYIIGAYIRLYGFKTPKRFWLAVIHIASTMFSFVSIYVIAKINDGNGTAYDPFFYIRQNAIAELIGAISIFLIFKDLKVKQSKTINYIAKISTATYLISDHDFIRVIFWDLWARTQEYITVPFIMFVGHIVGSIIIIFAIATVAETFRIFVLEKPLFKIKLLDKYFDKLDSWINA